MVKKCDLSLENAAPRLQDLGLEKTPNLLTSLGSFAGKVAFSWTLTVDV